MIRTLSNRFLTEYDEIYSTDAKVYESVGGLKEDSDISHKTVKEILKDAIQPEDKLPTVLESSSIFSINNKSYLISSDQPESYTHYISKIDCDTITWESSFGLSDIEINFRIKYYEKKISNFYVMINGVKSTIQSTDQFSPDTINKTQDINFHINNTILDNDGNPILNNVHKSGLNYDNTRCTECNFKIIGITEDSNLEFTIYDRSVYFVMPICYMIYDDDLNTVGSYEFTELASNYLSEKDIGSNIIFDMDLKSKPWFNIPYIGIPEYAGNKNANSILVSNNGIYYRWFKCASYKHDVTNIQYNLYKGEEIKPDFTSNYEIISYDFTIEDIDMDSTYNRNTKYSNNVTEKLGGFMINSNVPIDDRSVVSDVDKLDDISNRTYDGLMTYVDDEDITYVHTSKGDSGWNKMLSDNMTILLNGGTASD